MTILDRACRGVSMSTLFALLSGVTACQDDGVPGQVSGADLESSSGGSESSGVSATTFVPVDPESSSEDEVGESFIPLVDISRGVFQCDVWGQDCPAGQKCMPYADDGGAVWNATRCSELEAAPGQPGDSCSVREGGTSGRDSCDVSSLCWDVDPETNLGTCVAFCEGSSASPVCSNPETDCSITNGGSLILCLPKCDPIAQSCTDGQGCYPGASGFFCAPDASGPDFGRFADPCGGLNVCDPGLFCVDASSVPGCTTGSCCSEFCDLLDPAPCSGEGQQCTAYYDEGQAPPDYEDVGICILP